MTSTATLKLTANDMDVALLLVGRDHRISFANAAAHQLLGYPSGGLNGLPLGRLIPAVRAGELRNVDDVFAGQAARRVRSVVTRADAGVVDVSLALEPCYGEGGAVVAVSLRYEPVARGSTGSRGLDPHGARLEMFDSGIRLDAGRVSRLVAEQLGGVLKLIAVLDEHVVRARTDARSLEHARGVLNEVREIIEDCSLDLGSLSPGAESIPKAPRLPRE